MDEPEGRESTRRWWRGAGIVVLIVLLWLGIKLVGRSVGRQAAMMSVEQESIAQQAPPGFLEAKWLMSMDEVEALYPEAVVFAPGNLKLETKAFDRPAFVDFMFTDNLLLIIVVSFRGEKTEATFRDTQVKLVEEYGAFEEPAATADHRLASNKRMGRIVVQHLLYRTLGMPIEQVVLHRAK